MKVLVLCLGVNAGLGGLERFNQRLARALEELRGREISDWYLLSLRDRCEACPPGDGNRIEGFGRSRLRFLGGVFRALLRVRPDVVVLGHALLIPLLPLVAAFCWRARRMLIVHGVEVWGEPWRKIRPVEKLLAARFLHRIISVSKFTAMRMKDVYAVKEEMFTLLPNAVDVPSEEAVTASVLERPIRILTVARMNRQDRQKGVGEVIRAMPAIVRRFPDVRYEVIGCGELVAEYQAVAEDLGVADKVQFLGGVSEEEKDAAFRRARLFVLPSRKEGFGIVFLEAWSYALPVIGGARDAAAEVIAEGETGLLVDGDSPQEIANAVICLLRDPEYAESLGRRGFERVRTAHSHEYFCGRLSRVLIPLQSQFRAPAQTTTGCPGDAARASASGATGAASLEGACES